MMVFQVWKKRCSSKLQSHAVQSYNHADARVTSCTTSTGIGYHNIFWHLHASRLDGRVTNKLCIQRTVAENWIHAYLQECLSKHCTHTLSRQDCAKLGCTFSCMQCNMHCFRFCSFGTLAHTASSLICRSLEIPVKVSKSCNNYM